MFKHALGLALLLGVSTAAWAQQAGGAAAAQPGAAQAPRPPAIKTHLKIGDVAPDFNLPGTDGKTYKLSDFKGKKNVVLAIFVLAFTGG
jgi:cytochrome oxidase Cu insertion factor (SCO1/SenC/PrrC family)